MLLPNTDDREALRVGTRAMDVSSQRVREQRIVDRFHTGAVALSGLDGTVRWTPREGARCHGCLDPEADAWVGDHPWHALCLLFWKGRSDSLRDQPIPHTPRGTDILPARPRWVMVVPMHLPDTYTALRRRFARSPWVNVVIDRRRGERRPDLGGAPTVDRRQTTRRGAQCDPSTESGFLLAHHVDGSDVYESQAPESGHCPQCRALVSVDLPRFGNPPVRLELIIRHESTSTEPGAVRHIVELQSFSATGRVLVATRFAGRDRTEST